MTNVTISISASQIFPSWEAIIQPRLPTASLFSSLCVCIWFDRACFSYGCFILRATQLSNKLLEQGYVKERLKSSLRMFYGRYVDLIMILPILTSSPNFGGFHRTLQRVRLANIGRLLLRTPFGTCIVLMLRPFFPQLIMSTDLLILEHPSVLLFCSSPLPMCHCWWTNCPRGYLSGSNCLWNAEKSG